MGEHSGDTTVAYAEGGEEYTGEDVNLRHTEVSGAAFPELKFATTLLYSTLHGIVSSDLDAGSLFIAANVILNHMGLFGDRIHLLHHAMLKGGLFDRSAAGRIIAMPAVLNMLMRLTSNRMPISKSAMQVPCFFFFFSFAAVLGLYVVCACTHTLPPTCPCGLLTPRAP